MACRAFVRIDRYLRAEGIVRGLTFKLYRGEGVALLAFDLDPAQYMNGSGTLTSGPQVENALPLEPTTIDGFVNVGFTRGFASAHPTVFTGSSNMAQGGEEDNGDHMVQIEDRKIACS